MPKYRVTVLITNTPREKELTIYAPTESEAEDKAYELVTTWDGVDDVEIVRVDEE